MWNTNGLHAGDYILQQLVKNNLGDSIEIFLSIQLLASVVKSQNQSKQQ
jgi:hypothetical protein